MMWDPDKLAAAKVSAAKQARIILRFLAFVLICAAYWVGVKTGELHSINIACANWINARPH